MNQISQLNLAEKFILLAMHPEKARYLASDQAIIAGLTGAILLDLTVEEKLAITDKKLQAKSNKSELSQTHQQILSLIYNSPKQRTIKVWIQRLSNKSRTYRKQVLEGLAKKTYVKIEYKRFLFIPYINAYLMKKSERIKIIDQARDILIYSKKPDSEMASLLGLIEASKMHRVIGRNRAEIKDFRKKLKELVKSDLIASGVNQVINEMQAAITAAVISTTVVATSVGR